MSVDGQVVSSIGRGLLVLAGIGGEDDVSDIETIVNKIMKIKLWQNAEGKTWRRSVQDLDGDVLCGMLYHDSCCES